MKKINLNEYNEKLGTFIDINNEASNVVNKFIHIPYEKILVKHSELLDKKKKYYIYCSGGIRSKRVVSILEIYGYDVTYVYK